MSFYVRWHSPAQNLVTITCEPSYDATWDDYHTAMAVARRLAATQPHAVGLIVVAHDAPRPPGNALDHIGPELERLTDNTLLALSLITGAMHERTVLSILEEMETRTTPHVTVTNWDGAYCVCKMFGLLPSEAVPTGQE